MTAEMKNWQETEIEIRFSPSDKLQSLTFDETEFYIERALWGYVKERGMFAEAAVVANPRGYSLNFIEEMIRPRDKK